MILVISGLPWGFFRSYPMDVPIGPDILDFPTLTTERTPCLFHTPFRSLRSSSSTAALEGAQSRILCLFPLIDIVEFDFEVALEVVEEEAGVVTLLRALESEEIGFLTTSNCDN